MVTITHIFLLALSVQTAIAGPACARKMRNKADCIAACAGRWGWPGNVMGSDPWGSVMLPNGKIGGVEAACGEAASLPASSSSTPSSAAALPTLPVVQNPAPIPGSQSTSVVAPSVTTTTRASSTSSSTVITTSVLPTSTGRGLNAIPTSSSSSSPAPPPSTTSRRPTSSQAPAPVPTTSRAPSPSPSPSPNPAPANNANSGTSSSDISAYLAGHNDVRADHGAAPLTWSNDLAAKAQQWANRCVFQHSQGALGRFGENLAAGTGANYNIATAIKSWTDEVSDYNPNNPVASHFTQVVWKGTSQVGCAVQLCDGIFPSGTARYFVCEYNPPGNVIGTFAQNVQV